MCAITASYAWLPQFTGHWLLSFFIVHNAQGLHSRYRTPVQFFHWIQTEHQNQSKGGAHFTLVRGGASHNYDLGHYFKRVTISNIDQGGRKRFSGSRIFDRFSHMFTRNLLLKALKILIVGYVMLKIIMTHNLPGFKNDPSLSTIFSSVFYDVPSQWRFTRSLVPIWAQRRLGAVAVAKLKNRYHPPLMPGVDVLTIDPGSMF